MVSPWVKASHSFRVARPGSARAADFVSGWCPFRLCFALPHRPDAAILPTPGSGAQPVELYSFDEAYVRRLREGDPSTEMHFVAYFQQLLGIKLRARYLPQDAIEDLRQETFIRVLRALRSEGGIRQPERLGAFVNSVCNNVLQEHYRASARTQPVEDSQLENSGNILNLEGLLISEQAGKQVRLVLSSMPERDRDLLRAMFFEDKDKDEICREFGVERDYLRVLFHRAKERFRLALAASQPKRSQYDPGGSETNSSGPALSSGRTK